MDAVDHWSSRLTAARRQFSLHQNQIDRFDIDDIDGEMDASSDYPCPFCCEDFDIGALCMHLEDEHSLESRVAVCPVCCVKVARDMLNHLTVQHSNLFKICSPNRRRRLRKVAIPSSQAMSFLGRDLREAHLQVLLGGGGLRSTRPNETNADSDRLLSSLIMNFPPREAEDISKSLVSISEEASETNDTAITSWPLSLDPSLSSEERQKMIKEVTVRTGFVQDLLLSTFF